MTAEWKLPRLQRVKKPDPLVQENAELKAEVVRLQGLLAIRTDEVKNLIQNNNRLSNELGEMRSHLFGITELRRVGVFSMDAEPRFLQGESFDEYLKELELRRFGLTAKTATGRFSSSTPSLQSLPKHQYQHQTFAIGFNIS